MPNDSYDSWKLDNGEKDHTCDKCNCTMSDHNSVLAMGEYELVCDNCAEDMMFCECCCSAGEDECFSYGQEMCDNCCDLQADKMSEED